MIGTWTIKEIDDQFIVEHTIDNNEADAPETIGVPVIRKGIASISYKESELENYKKQSFLILVRHIKFNFNKQLLKLVEREEKFSQAVERYSDVG